MDSTITAMKADFDISEVITALMHCDLQVILQVDGSEKSQ